MAALPALALLLGCFQQSVGVGPLEVPVASLALAVLLVIDLLIYRPEDTPRPGIGMLLVVAVLCLGVVGLTHSERVEAIKELLQLAEVFGVSWFLFARRPREERAALLTPIALVGALLLASLLPVVYEPVTGLSDARRSALLSMSLPALVVVLSRNHPWLATLLAAGVGALLGLSVGHGGQLICIGLVCVWAALGCAKNGPWMAAALTVFLVGAAWFRPDPAVPWERLRPTYGEGYTKRAFLDLVAASHTPELYPLGAGLGTYNRAIGVLRRRNAAVPHPDDRTVPRDSSSQFVLTTVEAGPMAGAILLLFLGLFHLRRTDTEVDHAYRCAAFGLFLSSFFATTLARGIGIWFGAMLGLAQPERRRGSAWWLVPSAAWCLFWAVSGVLAVAKINRYPDTVNHVSTLNQRLVNLRDLSDEDGPMVPVIEISLDGEAIPPLVFEAESFSVSEGFEVLASRSASQGKVLALPPDAPKRGGTAKRIVKVPASGRYRLRAYVRWQDGCANSLSFQVQQQTLALSSDIYERWHTLLSDSALLLPAGEVELVIQSLEAGIQLDSLELVPL